MFDIPQIVQGPALEVLLFFSESSPAIDLCPSGDARAYVTANRIGGEYFPKGLVEFDAMGTRTDYGHAAFEDIQELGQLIEAVAAKKFTDMGYADIVRLGGLAR